MTKCEFCGKEVDIPFNCNYCNRSFCADHRLPEAHSCTNLIFAKPPSKPQTNRIDLTYNANKRGRESIFNLKFGSELEQLIIAWVVLSFCFSVRALFSSGSFPLLFGTSLGTLGLGFIGHEISHRYVARRFGCWAEFRLWPMGLIMALMFSLISGGTIIFAAPGAVFIVPRHYGIGYGIGKRENGLISISGPLMNIIVALFFYIMQSFGGIFSFIGLTGYNVNLWLAAFNLIPFGMMDGRKIFSWNPIIWAIVAIPTWLVIFIL